MIKNGYIFMQPNMPGVSKMIECTGSAAESAITELEPEFDLVFCIHRIAWEPWTIAFMTLYYFKTLTSSSIHSTKYIYVYIIYIDESLEAGRKYS